MMNNLSNNGTGAQVLVAEALRKSYGPREALRDLSFFLNAGRVMGFLGPNGAGKTTAIRILTTILEPTSGRFVVDGISWQHPEEIRRRIGVLPENLGFPRNVTGLEYLTYFGQLYGQSSPDAKKRAQMLLDEVGMQARARSLIGTYSHGMRQRIGIARALVNDPVVVFLDEPTLGLDPRGQQELLGLVQRIARDRNVGVILCSHALTEIEAVCDDVIILMSGRVITTGPVNKVIRQAQQNAIRVRVPAVFMSQTLQTLDALPNVISVKPSSDSMGWLRVELVGPADYQASEDYYDNNDILKTLIHAKIPIQSFEAEGGRLQDVFLQLTDEGIQ
jgi:ABC-2 type transport system ATP-binding protein